MSAGDDIAPTPLRSRQSTRLGPDRRDLRRGGALLAVGLWLLIGTLGGPELDHGRTWPLLLVFLGIAFLLTPVGERGRRPGPLLIVWGALCWVAVHEIWGLGWNSIWPLILVAVGLSLVWGAIAEQRRTSEPPVRAGDDTSAGGGDG